MWFTIRKVIKYFDAVGTIVFIQLRIFVLRKFLELGFYQKLIRHESTMPREIDDT